MRGSAAFRTGVAPGGALAGPWVKNELYRKARAVPSLDLRFADNKLLTDAITGANLVTFTRASSGTFVGSGGLIQSAVTNFLLQSEDLSTTWTANDGLARTVNQIVSPNGSTTADLLASNGILIGYLEQPVASSNQFVSGTTYTYSVYLKKANTSTCLTLLFGTTFNSGGGNPTATWNLDTGVPTFANGATGSMTVVGNGWYRCVMTDTATQTHTQNQQWLRMASASGDVYAWGAQLEQASTAGEYIPTTSAINSAPRFDHNPTTGESLGLLVEEARTNLITTSEALANITGASITNNTTTAPDGLVTADTLTEDTSTGGHSVNSASISWAGNTAYTFTFFLKANTRTQANIAYGTSSNWVSGQRNAVFDLSAGTVIATAGSSVTASIEPFLNSWYRCRLTATTVAVPVPSAVQTQMYVSGSASYTGNGTSGLFFWGAQLEAHAFPTSYIPTTSATVTRAADVASITGTNFSSFYNQTEGTVFAEAISVATNTSVFSISDNSTNNRIQLETGSNTRRFRITSSGSARYDNSVSYTFGTQGKTAGAYLATSTNHATNGTLGSNSTASPLPVVDRIYIGSNAAGSLPNNGTIKRLVYFPQRLPNNTLQAITQP